MKRSLKKSSIVLVGIGVLCWFAAVYVLNNQDAFFDTMYSDKMWVHRVNSVEKLSEVQDTYVGVELDLVYKLEDSIFDVNHPPAPSTGLNLHDYLGSIQNPAEQKLWLDYKNLDAENEASSLSRLQALCDQYGIPTQHIIVESMSPEYLGSFSKAGFKTSYYLPRIAGLSGDQKEVLMQEINKSVADYSIHYISADKIHLGDLKTLFPEKEILTWIANKEADNASFWELKKMYNKFIRARKKYAVLSDPQIKIVLYSYKAKEGNY